MFIVSSITEHNTARTITYNKAIAHIQQVFKQHHEIPDPSSRRSK